MSDALDTKSPWSSLSQPKSASQYYAKQMLDKPPEERQKYAEELAYNQLSLAPLSGEAIAAKEAKDYFEEGRTGMGLFASAGAIPLVSPLIRPLTKSAGSLVNKIAQNTPTHIKDFYSGNPLKGMFNFGKEFAKATPKAVKESIDPQAVAKRRVQGISDPKIDDWASELGQDADLTAISINRQLPNTEGALLEKSVVGLKYLDSRIPREDTTRLATGIGQGFREGKDVPESIVNRALTHLTNGPHIKNPKGVYEYQIKDPSSGANVGYREAAGKATTSSPISRAMNAKTTDDYLKVLNKTRKMQKMKPLAKLEGKDMVEYVQMASTLDNKAYQLMKKSGAGDYQPSVMLETLLRARAKQNAGRAIGVGEKQILNTFDKLLNAKAIKMARVSDEAGNPVGARNVADIKQPEGYIVTQQSFVSGQQELGGMNAFVVVDPSKEKMYSMLSDGHDIFGLNPVGGKNLITVSPIIENSYKTGSKWDSKQIKKRASKRNVNRAIKEVEEATGIKKKKSETPEAFTKRALRVSKPAVTEADRIRALAAKRKLQGTGAVGGGMLTAGAVSALSDDE